MSTNAPNRVHHGKSWWSNEEHDDDNTAVARADTVVSGHTIAKWTESWWQWAAQAPDGPFNAGSSQSFAQKGMIFISDNFSGTIHAAAHTPILASMVNAFDTEGPGIPESLNNFVADGRGSYADEARVVTDMIQNSIYDAFAKLTIDLGNGHTKTIFDVHLQGKEAAHAGVQSGNFALGAPVPDSLLASFNLVLDPSVANLPFSRSTGDWIEIDGLKPGTYTLTLGGAIHESFDAKSGSTVFAGGYQISVTDTLIIK